MNRADTTSPIRIVVPSALFLAIDSQTSELVTLRLQSLMMRSNPGADPRVEIVADTHEVSSITVQVGSRRLPVPITAVPDILGYVDRRPPSVSFDSAIDWRSWLSDDSIPPHRRTADTLAAVLALTCWSALTVVPGEFPDASVPTRPGGVVDVIVERRFLRRLTADPDASELLPYARQEVWEELGFFPPALHLRTEAEMRPREFVLEFDGVRTIPAFGLGAKTLLVNDTPGGLERTGIDAVPTRNPATGLPAALVDRRHKRSLEADGWTTWNSLGHFLLVLTAELRLRAAYLLSEESVADLLDHLERAFPSLTVAARDVVGVPQITSVLRELLRDRISIRNLSRILELLLRYETVDQERAGTNSRTRYVRSGLAAQITAAADRGTGTVVVFLLSPDLESALAVQDGAGAPAGRHRSRTVGVAEQLRAATETELMTLAPHAAWPPILTRDDCRDVVRDALRDRLPRINVLSYGDLLPWTNIQPIARIGRN